MSKKTESTQTEAGISGLFHLKDRGCTGGSVALQTVDTDMLLVGGPSSSKIALTQCSGTGVAMSQRGGRCLHTFQATSGGRGKAKSWDGELSAHSGRCPNTHQYSLSAARLQLDWPNDPAGCTFERCWEDGVGATVITEAVVAPAPDGPSVPAARSADSHCSGRWTPVSVRPALQQGPRPAIGMSSVRHRRRRSQPRRIYRWQL